MKIRIWDRILTALSGLLLMATGLFCIIEKDLGAASLTANLERQNIISTSLFYGGILGVLLGLYLLTYLGRGVKKKNSLVIQKTDYGELTIAVKAIEGMVLKCVREYPEVELLQTKINNTREGIVVRLKVILVQDISIPLTVNSLQKHIKQYVTASAGIDVSQVQVEVVSTDKKGAKGNFAIKPEHQAPPVKKEHHKPFHQSLFEKNEEKPQAEKEEIKDQEAEKDIYEEALAQVEEAEETLNQDEADQTEAGQINETPEEE